MKYILLFFFITSIQVINAKNHQSKTIRIGMPFLKNSSEFLYNNAVKDFEQEPTYEETVDWILEKLRLYAKTIERPAIKHYDEGDYEKVTESYPKFEINYGRILIIVNVRYTGGSSTEENDYKGFLNREKMIEIPINDISNIYIKENSYGCYLKFEMAKKSIKYTTGFQSGRIKENFPMPTIEYVEGIGINLRCDTEQNLSNRLNTAMMHLKKLNKQIYPTQKEKF